MKIDPDVLRLWSQAAEETIGQPHEEFLARFVELVRADLLDRILPILEASHFKIVVRNELRRRTEQVRALMSP